MPLIQGKIPHSSTKMPLASLLSSAWISTRQLLSRSFTKGKSSFFLLSHWEEMVETPCCVHWLKKRDKEAPRRKRPAKELHVKIRAIVIIIVLCTPIVC